MAPPMGGKKLAFVDNPIFEVEKDGAGRQDDQRRRTGSEAGPNSKRAAPYHQSIEMPVKGANDDLEEMLYPKKETLLKKLKWEFWAVNTLIIAHIVVTAYTDPLLRADKVVKILMVSVQIGLLVAIAVGFFVLTSQTLFVQLGRYDKYLKTFRLFYLAFVVELLLMVGSKAYFIVLLTQNVPHLRLWRSTGYLPLFVAQRVVLALFWVIASYSTFQAYDPTLYDPDYVMDAYLQNS